ncbi:unnamed protein product [Effrenium voratum]|nr:unnamed protein product [Effrenium voratum]
MSKASEQTYKGGLGSVYLAVFFDLMGMSMVMPLVPFLAVKMEATPFEIGLMQSLFSAFQALGTIILGSLSDILGKRRILLLSLFNSSVCLLLFGLAETMPQLLLFRALHGFFAGTVNICQSIVADVSTPEERVEKMSKTLAAVGAGAVLGPGVASLLARRGPLAVCGSASVATFLNFCVAVIQVPDTRHFVETDSGLLEPEVAQNRFVAGVRSLRKNFQLLFADPRYPLVFYVNFIQFAVFGVFLAISPLAFLDFYDVDAVHLGRLLCLSGLTMVLFQGLMAAKIVAKIGRPLSIVIGNSMRVFVFCLVAGWRNPWVPVDSCVINTMAGGFIDNCLSAIASEAAPKELTGLFMGVFQAGQSVALFLSPQLGGYLYGISKTSPFWLNVAMLACAYPAIASLWLHSAGKKVGTESPTSQA